MKLRFSSASPFVRKVNVVALETGLEARIEQVNADAWDPKDDLPKDNPLGKVPALVTDDGLALFESDVICEYLDSLHSGPKLFPSEGAPRWCALRQQALGDGIMEAAVSMLIETLRRPEAVRWPAWVERQREKINRALDTLDREVGELESALTIGPISVAIALDYLDFRFADFGWRNGRSALAHWYEGFAQRPAMQATRPRAP